MVVRPPPSLLLLQSKHEQTVPAKERVNWCGPFAPNTVSVLAVLVDLPIRALSVLVDTAAVPDER